jgi:hypothetical protein
LNNFIIPEEIDGLTGKVNLDDRGDRNLNFQVLDMSENGTFSRIITINYFGKGLRQVNFEVWFSFLIVIYAFI